MSNRSTYESSVAAASTPRVSSNTSNATTAQESINVVGAINGKILQRGVSVADDLTIRAANTAYVVAKQKAAMLEQVTIQNAKDLLRSTGDTGPA
jgi:hypothetical protein